MNGNIAENTTRANGTTTILFSQVFHILNSVTKRIEENFYVSLTDGKKDLLLQISDFQSHLEALKTYVDCREQSRTKLELTMDYLRNEIKKLNENSKNSPEAINKSPVKTEIEPIMEVKTEPAIPIEVMEDEDGEETEEDEEGEPVIRKKRRTEKEIPEEGKEKVRTRRTRKPRIIDDYVIGASASDGDDIDYEENPKSEKKDNSPASLESKPLSPNQEQKYGSRKRGKLPNDSTSVLKKWILQHWFHPYPSEEEKSYLCHQTGLSLTQLNNWFTNARRRLLKRTLESKADELFQQYPKPEGTPSNTHPMAHYPHSIINGATSPKQSNNSTTVEAIPASQNESNKSSTQSQVTPPPAPTTTSTPTRPAASIVNIPTTVIPFTLSDRVSIPASAMIHPTNSVILASYPMQTGKSVPTSGTSSTTVSSSSQERSSKGMKAQVNSAVSTPIATQ